MKFYKFIAILIVALITNNTSFAQVVKSKWAEKSWTSGSEQLQALTLDGQKVFLLASGYYDGGYGYAFRVKQNKNYGSYDLVELNKSEIKLPSGYEFVATSDPDYDFTWHRESFQGVDVILKKNKKKEIAEVYTPLDPGQTMEERAFILLRMMLCGDPNNGSCTYYTADNRQKYTFKDDNTCVFEGKELTYSITYDNATPSSIIQLSNGKSFYFEVTPSGIDLYNTVYDEDGDAYETKGLYKNLFANNDKPRWEYLSNMVIDGTFFLPCSNALAFMRNEIYARKGYSFSNQELKLHFRSCPWYKEGKDNSKIKLTPIETLNVSILKIGESRK